MIPLDKDQIEDFVPDSLKNIVPTPTFRFRAATPRDKQRYGHQLNLEGLRLFPEGDVRAEVLRVLKLNWDEQTFETQRARLETAWAMADQDMEIDPAEAAAITELATRCMDVSPLLRRMDADNKQFRQQAPLIALSLFLAGWSNLETPFRLEAGVVPVEAMLSLAEELREIEEKAETDKVDGVSPGLGFLQLGLKAFELLGLTRSEEKNSPSPSSSRADPETSTESSLTDGESPPAAAITTSPPKKTRRAASPAMTSSSSASGPIAEMASPAASPGQMAEPISTSP